MNILGSGYFVIIDPVLTISWSILYTLNIRGDNGSTINLLLVYDTVGTPSWNELHTISLRCTALVKIQGRHDPRGHGESREDRLSHDLT